MSRISVVIPCYRGAQYLALAVASCGSAVTSDLDLVIVNDASPDTCGAIADELAAEDDWIRVVHHHENRGVAEAFNSGFEACKGEYLVRLAQDDLYYPGALDRMAAYLDAHPDVDLVYGDMDYIDEKGVVTGHYEASPAEGALKTGNGVGLCWMFRRRVWQEGLRFDSSYDQIEDFEFLMRVSQKFRIGKLDGPPLLQFRRHGAMGTVVHGAKMEILSAGLIVKYLEDAAQASAIMGRAYFNASYILRKQGKYFRSMWYALIGIRYQPGAWAFYRNFIGAMLRR